MATIRKRSGKYHAQIRKTGYQTLTKTFSSLTTAKRWASATEADMERSLHVVIPDNTTVGELLDRYEEEISPLHKSHQVEKYRLQTLKTHLGDKRVSTLSVRRHINWDKLQVELTESLAHLVCHIRRQTCGVASAVFRLSFV